MSAKLILLRHGQSIWNQKNLFTGWVDIPLSKVGVEEARKAGKKIADIPIDAIYTSTLIRAHMTLCLAFLHHSSGKTPLFVHSGEGTMESWSKVHGEEAKKTLVPVYRASELNERMYGELQGLNKAETAEKYGAEQVHIWRRSYDVAPPGGESLKMTAERTLPYFKKEILPRLEKGENLLISAHGNSLRAIVMHIQNLSEEEVLKLEIPTGDPLVYTLKEGRFSKV